MRDDVVLNQTVGKCALTQMETLMTLVFIILSFTSDICWAQVDTLTDLRDGKKYRIRAIGNTTWMIDNLDYEAEKSAGLTQDERDKFNQFDLIGRYYHFETADSVCPNGWRLPNTQDWIGYFDFLVKESRRKVKLETIELTEENYYFSFVNYEKKIDLFMKGNALHLNPTGRIEKGKFDFSPVFADYFTTDSKETFKGKSHIHIMNAYTTIHSHEHNLQPDKEEELRKFMVRCVRKEK
jgi:uncharacterized protein (TIGR02145 family)